MRCPCVPSGAQTRGLSASPGESRAGSLLRVYPTPSRGRQRSCPRACTPARDEARVYLAHPVLGARLRECAEAALATKGRAAEEIFGPTDAMKLRSSMTLFHRAAPDEPVFAHVLDRFYGGVADEATDARL